MRQTLAGAAARRLILVFSKKSISTANQDVPEGNRRVEIDSELLAVLETVAFHSL